MTTFTQQDVDVLNRLLPKWDFELSEGELMYEDLIYGFGKCPLREEEIVTIDHLFGELIRAVEADERVEWVEVKTYNLKNMKGVTENQRHCAVIHSTGEYDPEAEGPTKLRALLDALLEMDG